MSGRDRIMGRLNRVAPSLVEAPDVEGWFAARRQHENIAERVRRLRESLEAVRAEVHLVHAHTWGAVLLELAAAKGIKRLLVGDDLDLPNADGLTIQRYDQPVETWKDQLFNDVDAGLTRARSAIAATGSLVLWPDAHEPRLLSLVPPLHFVLLDAATIHADLMAAMTAEGWKDRMPTNAVLVSGPSKTADIQQTLAYGAHGPRELIVLVQMPAEDA